MAGFILFTLHDKENFFELENAVGSLRHVPEIEQRGVDADLVADSLRPEVDSHLN